MITSITVDGFKTLSRFNLILNPGLNILVGPNGSGKTNIITFFEFLSHLIEGGPSEATSHLGGAGAVFRRITGGSQSNISAVITGSFSLKEANIPLLPHLANKGNQYAVYRYSFSVLFSSELESVVFVNQRLQYKHVSQFVTALAFESAAADWDLDIELTLSNSLSIETHVRSLRGDFVDFFPVFRRGKNAAATKEAEEFISRFATPRASIPSLLIRFTPVMMPLSADIAGGQTFNIIPSRVRALEDSAKPPGISSDGSGLSTTLYSLRRENVTAEVPFWGFLSAPSRSSLKRPSLKTLISYFQLANSAIQNIEVSNDSFTNQLRVTVDIKNGEYTAKIPLALLSDGTLKWLTLLTAALTATSICSVEEPENYLHPTMQGQFVRIIREILFTEREHSCTLMSTHSETLLNHCKPSELIIVSLQDGRTVPLRCIHEHDISDEIAKTGFGLGYYYISGALNQ